MQTVGEAENLPKTVIDLGGVKSFLNFVYCRIKSLHAYIVMCHVEKFSCITQIVISIKD